MSLVRLLAAGKSLVGLKPSTSRYHLSGHRLLPKFEARKNPFREPSIAAGETDNSGPKVANECAASTTAHPPAAPLEPVAGSARDSARPAWGLAGSWAKLAALWSRRKRKGSRPVQIKTPKGLVQGELSLEAVKVVRNDLTDSDLEVVTARSSARSSRLPEHAQGANEVRLDEAPTEARNDLAPRAQTGETGKSDRPSRNLKVSVGALVGRLFGAGKP